MESLGKNITLKFVDLIYFQITISLHPHKMLYLFLNWKLYHSLRKFLFLFTFIQKPHGQDLIWSYVKLKSFVHTISNTNTANEIKRPVEPLTPDLKKETFEKENDRIKELLESFISNQEIASEIGK